MDKYQKYIFESSRGCCGLSVCGKYALEKVVYDDKIIFKQNEDITITDYVFYIANIGIQSVFAVVGETETPLVEGNIPTSPHYRGEAPKGLFLPISFDNKIDFIKIVFKNNLADDFIFSVLYEEADKEKYYALKQQERKNELLKNASIKVSTGIDLVNIYFQPCCEEYARTEIVLYKDNMMLAKYKVDEETFFKSIIGLAFGKYEFILKQFDDKGNVILETDKMNFSLSSPNYGGRHTVVI